MSIALTEIKQMNEVKIIVANKKNISTKYLEQLFALQQLEQEEKWGMLPSEIELFRKRWNARNENRI